MAKRITVQENARYDALVSAFRQLVRGVPRLDIREGADGQPVVVDTGLDQPVFVACGVWQPKVLRYLTHLQHDSLIKLLGLLEAARGTDARREAVTFLESLRLIDPPAIRTGHRVQGPLE
ncbi:hypothetical protein [Lentzea flaviverrucosa]|uniref:Uncharacterized protein n=1 Tax=Lentzea flaviverrucosa TaxID=200379 RepID=A0A1H9ELZ7_9PSEU|nr:hypothetical protein [Lentzea flaviverrucosa]RDI35446.1 hypothetical protein DFR72_1011197 [Lentzea flaviverrucosa]SEQ26740.1 hypothetical protein SAMN05216195_10220 [Lentzea flaviverrucosa]